MSPALLPLIPLAQPGPITDETLERAIGVAAQAENGELTNDGAALLLFLVQPILKECLQWRRRMALIRDVAADGNLVMFPGTSK